MEIVDQCLFGCHMAMLGWQKLDKFNVGKTVVDQCLYDIDRSMLVWQ